MDTDLDEHTYDCTRCDSGLVPIEEEN
jgi:hypothetical protein